MKINKNIFLQIIGVIFILNGLDILFSGSDKTYQTFGYTLNRNQEALKQFSFAFIFLFLFWVQNNERICKN